MSTFERRGGLSMEKQGSTRLQQECLLCGNRVCYEDVLHQQWCEIHEYRGRLLDWGAQHGYPDLHCVQYAIGPGSYCWSMAILLGNDDFIGLMAAYVETTGEEELEEEIA